MDEIYKDIKGFKGYYVSNMGNVVSVKNDKITRKKASVNSNGYLTVSMYANRKSSYNLVHRLVAKEFLGLDLRDSSRVVNHIDRNRTNNCSCNLEVVSQRENCSYAREGKSSSYIGVHWVSSRNKWQSRILVNKKRIHLGYFSDELDAHKAYSEKLKQLNLEVTSI